MTELAPTGATISGFSDRYRFTLTSRDGRRTVIERRVEPVPIIGEERTWYEDRFHQTLRDDGGVEGGMPVIPTIKPFFQNFVPTHDGNLWVVRPGIGRQVQNCPSSGSRSQNAAPTECWQDSRVADVFGRDGRYLGGR